MCSRSRPHFAPITFKPDPKLEAVSGDTELYFIHPGPDGLARVNERRFGAGVRRSWVVPTTEAEESVLAEWRKLHRRWLRFWPSSW
jgi:hypothetical protein